LREVAAVVVGVEYEQWRSEAAPRARTLKTGVSQNYVQEEVEVEVEEEEEEVEAEGAVRKLGEEGVARKDGGEDGEEELVEDDGLLKKGEGDGDEGEEGVEEEA